MTKEERAERRAKRREAAEKDPDMIFLTPMQEKFIDLYCDREKPETYFRAWEAMKAAGYKNITTPQVKSMLANHRIKWGMTCWREKRGLNVEITRQKVLEMLLDQYNKADREGDRGNAIRSAELLGKSIAMFGDRIMITSEQQKAIDATLLKEARELSQIRMMDILEGTAEVLGENMMLESNAAVSQRENPENPSQFEPLSKSEPFCDPQEGLEEEINPDAS